MKKKILITIICFGIYTHAFSQDFYFGLNTGWIKEQYTAVGNTGGLKLKMEFLCPTVAFSFKTIFKNNVEVGTGIGFYTYGYNIGIPIYTNNKTSYTYSKTAAFRSLSIPISIGYHLPLYKNKLYLNFNSALNFDFYIPDKAEFIGNGSINNGSDEYIYNYGTESLLHKFNVLFANQISLQYVTNINLCISIFGAYHAGLRAIWQSNFNYNVKQTEEEWHHYNPIYTSRGSYWHFGIELGYKLKKNNRKTQKELL